MTGGSIPRGFSAYPGEVRNSIYALVLVEDAEIFIDIWKGRSHRPTRSGQVKVVVSSQPALTRVPRQLRQETLRLCYELSHFCVLVRDLDMLAVYNRWASPLGGCSLTNLVFCSNFEQWMIGNPSWHNYMKYLKAIHSQKVDAGTAAELVSIRPSTFPDTLRLTLIEMVTFASLAHERPWKEVKQSLCDCRAYWYDFGVPFYARDWRLREQITKMRPSL